jgi:hypothetical protein
MMYASEIDRVVYHGINIVHTANNTTVFFVINLSHNLMRQNVG